MPEINTTKHKPVKKNGNGKKLANTPIQRMIRLQFSPRDIFLWLLLAFVVFSLFSAFRGEGASLQEKPLSTVVADIGKKEIKEVKVEDTKLTVMYQNGDKFTSYKESQASLFQLLADAKIPTESVNIEIVNTNANALLWNFVANLVPTLIFIGFFLFMMNQARGAQDAIFSFGKSGAKLYNKNLSKVTFSDVAGIDEAKGELAEIVDFLKNPKKYIELGARTPKGVLLVGPSGTGKTLLARAVAGEAGVPFFSMAGSEFMEMLVGVGAKRVRDLFDQAKKSQPSIIFIDEIDAIGRRRSMGVMGSHDEREQTLNQILVEMDGFDVRTNVLLIAATNRGDLLDPALLRPGRFDRRISLELPDIEGRKAILKIHARGKPVVSDIDWEKVARRTVGFSGADLENMLNEAAILTARQNKKEIGVKDIEEAATKVKLGPEKRRLQTHLDKKMTAYHEAGHAIISHELPHMDPVHRISIVSRGMTLGYTLIPPEKDRLHETKSQMLEQITAMMGGRAAEELIFNEITSGASNDFVQATTLARLMVEDYGMSDLGPMSFGPQMDITEWGRRWMEQPAISPSMQERIDNAVKAILDACYKNAVTLLRKNKSVLDRVADELIKIETIEGDEFEKLMGHPKRTIAEATA